MVSANKAFSVMFALLLVNDAVADNVSASVQDQYKYVTETRPVESTECHIEQVPVYASRPSDSDTGGGQLGKVIIGTVIGSAIGNAISDKHGAGTVGGIIGANEALKESHSRDSREIVGYREIESCKPVRTRESRLVQKYSHSVITFWLDGRRYEVPFQRY